MYQTLLHCFGGEGVTMLWEQTFKYFH